MNTLQIDKILKDKCKDHFLGVFAKDTLPTTLPQQRPLLLVCNTDVKSRPGTHWIAMFIDKTAEYFDSFGEKPDQEFEQFMNRHCTSWTFNSRQLQSLVSYYCGQYCIFYCLYKCIGYDMIKIINSFTNDTGVNDWFVHKFVCRLIKKV